MIVKYFNKFLIVFIFTSAFNFLTNYSANVEKLPISIYYESLCPDSIHFITKQLYPTWAQFKDYLDFTFIPFGKSSSINNGESFVCQHGPKECVGNKLQSCTLSLLSSNELQVEFVNCFMGGLYTAEECANKVRVNFNEVKKCYNSETGTALQLQAEQYTNLIKPKFVPTIVINAQFRQREQDESLINFEKVVCNYIGRLYSQVCAHIV